MNIDVKELLQSSLKTKALHPEDIPALDLYIDQIIALMNTHLGTDGEKEPLTRTMIHNYSKAGLIKPVKGKKYSKEQILQMLAIYSLKNTLTIAQIKRILSGLTESGASTEQLAQCFDRQLARREEINQEMTQAVYDSIEKKHINLHTPADVLTFLLTLTDIIDTLTNFAGAVTQNCFPEPQAKK